MSSSQTIRRVLIIAIPVLIVVQAIVFFMLKSKEEGVAASGDGVKPALVQAESDPAKTESAADSPGKESETPDVPEAEDPEIETTDIAETETAEDESAGEDEEGDEEGEEVAVNTEASGDDGAAKAVRKRKERRRPPRKKRPRIASSEPSQPETTPEPDPETPKPTMAMANFRSTPAGASMALDGVFIGTSPMAEVKLAPGRHKLAFSLPGYDSKVKEFTAEASKLTTIKVTLVKSPAPEDHIATADTTPKPPVARPETPKRPRTPRIPSGREGNASSGKSLVGSKCNSCHQSKKVRSVSAGRLTRSQWTRFFAGGVHDRYDRLGGLVSAGDLAHIKSFLKAHAADVAKNQGAGVR